MDAEEARTIGRRVKHIRYARKKSLRVIAGLAGISKSHLSRIERGEVALDRLSDIVALADVLQIAPSELIRLPVPAPANGHTDSTTEAVRVALDAIDLGRPGGLALPVSALRDQVSQIHQQRRACQFAEVATALPALIRNLHTTLAAGTDHGALLDLAVYLHVHVTRVWLMHCAAPEDLIRRTVFLALRLAQERDDVSTLAVGRFGVIDALLTSGAVEPALAELDSVILPPVTAETGGLVAVTTAAHAAAAMLDGRPDEAETAMQSAAELAARFGESRSVDSLGFIYSPIDAAVYRMWLALESGEPDRAVTIARQLHPEHHPFRTMQTYHWLGYGLALAKMPPKSYRDAVMALRTAERLYPTMVLRHAKVRDTLAYLLNKSIPGEAGRELRGMAYRAGLPV